MGRRAREQRERRERGFGGGLVRRRRQWVVGTLLAVLVVAAGAGLWLWNGAVAAPTLAPKFNLFASTGRVITIDDFLGKQEIVLVFYMGAG